MLFKKVLELNYSHDYFNDSKASNLFTIKPLAQTQGLLANLQLQFKPTADGFFVFGRTKEQGEQYFIEPPPECTCSFAVYSNEPYMPNFTDMPVFRPGEQVFYGDCKENYSFNFTKKNLYPLQQKGLLVNTKRFTVELIKSPADGFQQTSEPGGEGNAAYSDPAKYYLDISQWPDGLYKLTDPDRKHHIKGSFYGKKVFVGRALIANPPMAIMSCALPDAPQCAQSISLSLTSRAVYWRYKITTADGVTGLSIDASGAKKHAKSPNITPPEFYAEGDGRFFLSAEQIPLTQAPWTGIKLKGNKDGNGDFELNNLPNPLASQLVKCQAVKVIGDITVKAGEYYAQIPVEI